MNTKHFFSAVIIVFVVFFKKDLSQVNGDKDLSGFKQKWGHLTIREHAHMFWWLYYTTANVLNYTERPLIIWLQGGPGMPSSGYGNFIELGPLDINYKKKNYSLIHDYNVLFIDNPIGVGYSYISDNKTEMPSNNREIGEDLVNFLKLFMSKEINFQNVPLYIIGESYGGKMAVEFAYQLSQVEQKDRKWNLKGIALGNSYISPIDYIRSYAPMALHLGLVDKQGFARIDELGKQIEVLINKKEYEEAADMENNMINALVKEMPGLDVYNIIVKGNISNSPSFLNYLPKFTGMMNNEIKQNLSLASEIEWCFLNSDVYYNLQSDLMKSVTEQVEFLLEKSDIRIIVYNGVLDFLVNTAGTRAWLKDLNWSLKEEWQNESQFPFEVDGMVEGYVKQVNNLVLYVIFRAGHSVPVDNMAAFRKMLNHMLLELE